MYTKSNVKLCFKCIFSSLCAVDIMLVYSNVKNTIINKGIRLQLIIFFYDCG